MDKMRYYIDGPGEVLITTTDFNQANPDPNKIICSATCKSATINAAATLEDVTGGRSLFPQRRFPTERTASVEFTDCEMDFRYARLVSGEEPTTGSKVVPAFGSDYRFVVPGVAPFTVTLPETPVADSMTVRFIESGAVANGMGGPTTKAPKLAGNVLTFAEEDAGLEFEVMYSYVSAINTIQTSLKVDSLPKTVKVVHKQPTFDNDNNITGYQYIEFFKMQPSPEFSEDYQERSAYAPTMTFDLVDPKRPDKKVYDRTWVPSAAASELTKIEVSTPPTTTAYNENDPISFAGMVVTATYADGSSKAVNGYILDPGEGTQMPGDDLTVIIVYTENGITKTTTQEFETL